MNLSNKIIELRSKNKLTQEELTKITLIDNKNKQSLRLEID